MKTQVRRNGPCPCGSGLKTKKCCLSKIKIFRERVNNGEDPRAVIVERILAGTPSEHESQPDPS